MNRTPLTKSRNKMIAGVLAGIAEHFGIDVTLTRLLYLLIMLATGIGPGIIVYLIAMLIIPEASPMTPSTPVTPSEPVTDDAAEV